MPLESLNPTEISQTPTSQPNAVDLAPQLIENSPVLQRWLREVPDVLEDIQNDPSFKTRVRLGYSHFPSHESAGGWNAGVEDVFIGRSGFTISGDYQASFNGDRTAAGVNVRYYALPLGSYVNIAPVVGYRHLETNAYSTSGIELGAKLMLALSRGGAADISLTQTWVKPGTDEDVGLTTFSVGYAVTQNLRISTDLQKQNARESKDSRVGVVLEWMP